MVRRLLPRAAVRPAVRPRATSRCYLESTTASAISSDAAGRTQAPRRKRRQLQGREVAAFTRAGVTARLRARLCVRHEVHKLEEPGDDEADRQTNPVATTAPPTRRPTQKPRGRGPRRTPGARERGLGRLNALPQAGDLRLQPRLLDTRSAVVIARQDPGSCREVIGARTRSVAFSRGGALPPVIAQNVELG